MTHRCLETASCTQGLYHTCPQTGMDPCTASITTTPSFRLARSLHSHVGTRHSYTARWGRFTGVWKANPGWHRQILYGSGVFAGLFKFVFHMRLYTRCVSPGRSVAGYHNQSLIFAWRALSGLITNWAIYSRLRNSLGYKVELTFDLESTQNSCSALWMQPHYRIKHQYSIHKIRYVISHLMRLFGSKWICRSLDLNFQRPE